MFCNKSFLHEGYNKMFLKLFQRELYDHCGVSRLRWCSTVLHYTARWHSHHPHLLKRKTRNHALFLFWNVEEKNQGDPQKDWLWDSGAWTDGHTGGQTSKERQLLREFNSQTTLQFLRQSCLCLTRSINPRNNVISSKWSLSSGGLPVSWVRPAAANYQSEWITGSLNIAVSFKS